MCNTTSSTCQIILEITVRENAKRLTRPKVTKVEKKEDGKVDKIDPADHEKMHPANGIIGMGQIFFTRSSPDCVYYYYDGDWWYICW